MTHFPQKLTRVCRKVESIIVARSSCESMVYGKYIRMVNIIGYILKICNFPGCCCCCTGKLGLFLPLILCKLNKILTHVTEWLNSKFALPFQIKQHNQTIKNKKLCFKLVYMAFFRSYCHSIVYTLGFCCSSAFLPGCHRIYNDYGLSGVSRKAKSHRHVWFHVTPFLPDTPDTMRWR